MKLQHLVVLGFVVFLLGGGLLYTYGLLGNQILSTDAYYANTTLWWFIVLSLWVFGLWTLKESLRYKENFRGLILVAVSSLMFFGGYMFAEAFILNH
jgi:hypothetical protein